MRPLWQRLALLLCTLIVAGCSAGTPPGTRPAAPTPAPAPPATPAPAPATPAPAPATPAPPANFKLEPLVTAGLSRPLALTHAGDGTGRLFVLEQGGRIRTLRGGKLEPTPFLDLTDRVNSGANERGLLGLAFAPDYARSGHFYVHYSGPGGETVVARYRVAPGDPNRADPESAEVLLTVPQPYSNHNGGALLFGPDGYLYLALGDGGSAGDPQGNAQNLNTLLGKILRLDVSQPGAYRIPPDNPFAGKAGRDEIWAYGLRNPWRIAFDRSTGDLYIADVGQNRLEEINFQPAGQGGVNYGWRVFEGTQRYRDGQAPGAVPPVAEYDHNAGGCSVTGGYVYRGQAIPGLVGTYLYADYCSGKIWGLRRAAGAWTSTELTDTDLMIVAFGEDAAGELYVVNHRGGVFRLAPGA